jgi:ABC-type multidrug transport system ATPase subunit/uncharacterized tellurite resistance protein B-like protein
MNEKLLDALMQLFAIIACDDRVTEEEVQVVRSFLNQQLSTRAADQYMQTFEGYAQPGGSGDVRAIAQQVGRELTQKQKVVILIRLIELINADRSITEVERQAVGAIADVFNIRHAEFDAIAEFIQRPDAHLIQSDWVMRVGDPFRQLFGLSIPDRLHLMLDQYPGYVAVLRVPSIETYILRYLGQGEIEVNGQAIQPNRVYFLAPGSVVRDQKHPPVYYSDIVGRFLLDSGQERIAFEASDLSFAFGGKKLGLRNVSLREESGRLVGLMGASGSGKSTLLNVLNGNLVPTEGHVRINGFDVHREKDSLKGVIGYVSQDDLLMEELTVYQNLYFNAKLCFEGASEIDIERRVMKLLTSLGLAETRDILVGSPLNKKISGGQRKRLNIALELIREPAVLFCDEPTSGLSSRDSENIMDLLKELSLRGKLVFVVIHQPSSDIFKMFDRLFIMDVGGYPIYYGNPLESISYFKRFAGHIHPEYVECGECGNVNPEQVFTIIETRLLDEDGNLQPERKFTPPELNEAYEQTIALPVVQPATQKPSSSLRLPPIWKQWWVFVQRDVLSKLRDTAYLSINFLEGPLLALILAFILRYANADSSNQEGYTLYENLNVPGFLFICILVSLFMGLTVSAEEILRDRRILKREKFLNLSRTAYLLSKVGILMLISGIQTLTFVLIGHAIMGIEGMQLTHWAVLFTVSFFANMLGLNISATFDNAVTIYILVPVLLIPQIILSGVIVKWEKINPAIALQGSVPLVGDLMASRWAYEALVVHQFRDNAYERELYPHERRMSVAQYRLNYWLPRVEARLGEALDYRSKPEQQAAVTADLNLVRTELQQELSRFKGAPSAVCDRLVYDKFDDAAGAEARKLLAALRAEYINRFNSAETTLNAVMRFHERDSAGKLAYRQYKQTHHNEALHDLATNRNDDLEILELDGRLIQNGDPVFHEVPASGRSWLDYRVHFFAPRKPWFGQLIDTFTFNLGVIWLMSLVLYFTLYYEAFRRFITLFAKPGR